MYIYGYVESLNISLDTKDLILIKQPSHRKQKQTCKNKQQQKHLLQIVGLDTDTLCGWVKPVV